MKYTQLSYQERYLIEHMHRIGWSNRSIAALLNRSPSTICRELKRNSALHYRRPRYVAAEAHRRTLNRHQDKRKHVRLSGYMKDHIRLWLRKDRLSPELITVRGRRYFNQFVSHETIYQWLYLMKRSGKKIHSPDRHLYKYLRHSARRRKRVTDYQNRGNIPERVGIEQRPDCVALRNRIGDLEMDLVMSKGNKPGLLVAVDRASLRLFIRRVSSKSAVHIRDTAKEMLGPSKDWIKTITVDNDKAFTQHQKISKHLKAPVFFTRPYTSQDKGTVENRIGTIRRFFPKKTDFTKVTDQQIERVQRILNRREIKKYNYETPIQKFNQLAGVALIS